MPVVFFSSTLVYLDIRTLRIMHAWTRDFYDGICAWRFVRAAAPKGKAPHEKPGKGMPDEGEIQSRAGDRGRERKAVILAKIPCFLQAVSFSLLSPLLRSF
jgi:hypothetical protein